MTELERKTRALRALLQAYGSAVVAFSGGVDSSVLLAVAAGVLPQAQLLAVSAQSPTYPRAELVVARSIARKLGVRHRVIRTAGFDDARFAANPPNRCYYCKSALFAACALDVYFTPIHMKKNRPAAMLSVIVAPSLRESVTRTILLETTSLGVREREAGRTCLERETMHVPTRFGMISVKIGKLDGAVVTTAPEYESCAAAARRKGIPIKSVYTAALVAASSGAAGRKLRVARLSRSRKRVARTSRANWPSGR